MEAGVLTADSPSFLGRRPRVLIVDDDRSIRLLCAIQLHAQGFDVIEAQDGQEGLERAVAEAPDVILLDVSMPILDGFGLAAALRGDERTQRLPFIFVSGEKDPDTETRAYAAGARGYVTKPFEPTTISASVLRVLTPLAPKSTPATGGHAF